MSALHRWVEHVQQRDAICMAILDLAAAVKMSSLAHRPGDLGEDLDDPSVRDARVQLAHVIEDPTLAAAMALALRMVWKRWEAEGPVTIPDAATMAIAPSLVQRLRSHLPFAPSKQKTSV